MIAHRAENGEFSGRTPAEDLEHIPTLFGGHLFLTRLCVRPSPSRLRMVGWKVRALLGLKKEKTADNLQYRRYSKLCGICTE